jgi:DNA-binding winged helix-turn-helix (wHTH) protein/tetratricopeptide (TPR) repeat protein
MNAPEPQNYSFGRFLLIPKERQLLLDGAPVLLASKAFDLLVVLVRNRGRLMTKDALLQEVWPGVIVEEVNLTVHISAIRKALGGNGNDEWIETVPRHGYRFRAEFLWRGALYKSGVEFASLAVLPFAADGSVNADLAEGLAEETLNRLSASKRVSVAPRTSAFRFKDPAIDPRTAGRALGVEAVVTGRVALRDDALEIQVDLVDVTRGAQAWGNRYRAAVSDLPLIQGRIVQDLLLAAGVALSPEQTRQLSRPLTVSADAYRAYLKGRFYWNQRTAEGLRRAILEFERAVAQDGSFAAAYSGLADAFTTLGFLSHLSPAASFPVARRHAQRALELDASLAEPHASLGYVKLYYDWDWSGAEAEFKRAVELNSAYAVTHQWYSVLLLAAGRPDEAFREILLAQERDPLSLPINTDVGFHHYYNRRYDAAVKQLSTVLEMKSDFPLAHLWLGRTYQELKQYPRSLEAYRQAGEKLGDWPVVVAARGYVHGVSGNPAEARRDLANLQMQARDRFVTAYGVALVQAGLGDTDAAFAWLENAFAERSHWLVWLRLDPRWDSIRGDPRFERLVARMGFPGQSEYRRR